MKTLLIPLVLLVVGVGGGVGAGLFLAPPAPEEDPLAATTLECPDPFEGEDHDDRTAYQVAAVDPDVQRDYARLSNQFVIPVVEDGLVAALVVLSLSVEVEYGQTDLVYTHEPKLRDSFLQVLFDHANTGGFSGSFTSTSNMRGLRDGLRENAQRVIGDAAYDVLITEIARQDV